MNTAKNPTEIKSKDEIRNRKVALYFNMASMSPPIELHAGLARDLLERGNDITVYIYDGSFKSPTGNPFNRKSIRRFAAFRAKDAIKGLPVKFKVINLDGISSEVSDKTLQSLELGVMSSIASATRANIKEELNKKWLGVYKNMLESAKKLYNYFLEEVEKEKYDFVFMFNGRFGCAKPALDAARDSGIGFGLDEVKKSTHEIVFVNQLVHSIDGNTERAVAAYNKDKESAKRNAEEFYSKKLKSEEVGDPVFTKAQEKGALPEAIVDTDKKIIAIYPTTEDEFKYIGKEWDGHVPESQVAEMEELAKNLDPNEYILVVKMHPNQANTAERTLEKYRDLAKTHKHVVVEPPSAKTDTYAIMSKSDVVVTFASTIGVEACYAGKPSVLIGDTMWSKMNVAHKVYSGKEAAEFIKKGLEPMPKEGAIIWGNYIYAYKDKLDGYKRVRNGDYWVDGRRIGKSTWRRILQLPAKLEIETSKPGFRFNRRFLSRIGGVINNITKGKWATN